MPYLTGTKQAQEAFKNVLDDLYEKNYIIMGSVARTAIGASLGWSKTKPLPLRQADPRKGEWRDIDALNLDDPKGSRYRRQKPDFFVHLRVSEFFGPNFTVPLTGNRRISALPLLRPTTERNLEGAKVRTLLLGNQLLVERLLNSPMMTDFPKAEKYLLDMAAWAKQRHKKEFLPPAAYKPFFDLADATGYQGMEPIRKILLS